MDLKTLTALTFVGAAAVLMQGCSTTTQAYYDSFKIAFSSNDAEVTLADVVKSRADLLEVKHGERDIAIMALAYIENDGYKWVSGDHAILTIDNGVVVRTSGLLRDLLYTTDTESNPLANLSALKTSWQRTIDLEDGQSGLLVTSQFREDGQEQLPVFGLEITTTRIIESVSVDKASPYFELGQSWENKYLVDKASGQVIYSEQKFAPDSEPLTFTFLSRASRLLTFTVVE